MPKRLHDQGLPVTRAISDEHWSAALRMAHELDKILDGIGPKQTAVSRAAAELRLTRRQIYNLLVRYRTDRTVTALLPRTANSRRKRLSEKIEAIIATTLRE